MAKTIFEQLSAGQAIDWNKVEVTNQPLYDTQQLAAAGATSLNFFQDPVDTGNSVYGAGLKTYEDTNMEDGGQMDRGNAYLAKTLELRITPGVVPVVDNVTTAAPAALTNFAANDEQAFWRQGWLEIWIQDTCKLRIAPLASFPPSTRLSIDLATGVFYTQATAADGTDKIVASGCTPRGDLYRFQGHGLALPYAMKFKLQLKWSVAVPLPSGNPAIVQAKFQGARIRAVA